MMYWHVAEGISFKNISTLAPVAMLFRRTDYSDHFGRGHHEEHYYEIILNLDQWFRSCYLMIFLSRALVAFLFSAAKQFV